MALHSLLTDPNLHEPKGTATANAGEVYVADGIGSGSWEEKIPSVTGKSEYLLTNNGTTESWSNTSSVRCIGRVTISGITPTLLVGNVNVMSVVRTGLGVYRVTFNTPLTTTNYFPIFSSEYNGGSVPPVYDNTTTAYFDIKFSSLGYPYDPTGFTFCIYGGF